MLQARGGGRRFPHAVGGAYLILSFRVRVAAVAAQPILDRGQTLLQRLDLSRELGLRLLTAAGELVAGIVPTLRDLRTSLLAAARQLVQELAGALARLCRRRRSGRQRALDRGAQGLGDAALVLALRRLGHGRRAYSRADATRALGP